MNRLQTLTLSLLLFLCCATSSRAQECDTLGRKVEWGAELNSELQLSNTGKFNFVNLLRLHADIPLSRTITWEAASISTFMTNEDGIGDDLQTFSNIEAERIPFTLSVCGLNWTINDRHSLFAGIRNMNEDYFASPVTGFFTNSTCGIYPTISVNYPIANYPLAAMGIHYTYNKEIASDSDATPSTLTLQASLYNGTGYYRFAGRENIFRVCPKNDGIFALAEAQYARKGSRYFLGTAYYYKNQSSASPWAYAEQCITPRMTLLIGYSYTFGHNTAYKDFVGLGAYYQFKKAELGVFTDYAHYAEEKEWATELTCKFSVTRNISLQPITHLILTGNRFSSFFSLRFKAEL